MEANKKREIIKEMISKVNIDALNAYIQETDDGGIDEVHIDGLLNQWAESKADIYVKFGNSFTISKEVECSLSDSTCRKLVNDFADANNAPQYVLANLFLKRIRPTEASANTLERDYYCLGTKFSKGMRVSRCFKQLIPGKLVSDYQTKFSMFIQQFKVKGEAVVSIDPIDYLTMSVNNSGWRSCHTISNGIHKAGCVAYMADPSTAISYTTDKRITANKKYEGLNYANKLWRQCVHIGETFAIQARQYPGKSISNKNAVAELLADMFNKHYGVSNFKYDDATGAELYQHQTNYYDGHAYNDIEEGSFDEGGGIITSLECTDAKEEININADALCVRCGENHISYADSLVCSNCLYEIGYSGGESYE